MLVVSFLVTDVRLVIFMDGYRSAFFTVKDLHCSSPQSTAFNADVES
jgi:hypothetical protein